MGEYDYVILDTPPGWDTLTINALFYADEVLAPVSLEVLTLQGLLDFSQNLSAIQRFHPSLELRYVLPTFFDRRVRKSLEIQELLKAHYERAALRAGALQRAPFGSAGLRADDLRICSALTGSGGLPEADGKDHARWQNASKPLISWQKS